jgi:decaprenylphospho-beta-D-erythro-pentofuranosid-2-ulose 2-reductase
MRDAVGKVQSVLLLGGTSDIGRAIVRELVVGRSGMRVVLAARRPETCYEFAAELRSSGHVAETVRFDADDTQSHRAVLDLAAAGGDLDVVVSAWGVLGAPQPTLDAQPELAVAVARSNYVGVVSVGLEAARVLRAQGHGALVHVSSVAAERTRRANFVYGSSKAGSDSFMQGLADSLVGSGVRVLVVRPGFVMSKMTAGMKAQPFSTSTEAVASATVQALRGGAHTVWVPGLLRYVFTVMRHLPRALWRRMPV